MNQPANQRVIAYIDGFNLYFGLRDSQFRRFYWLDVSVLASKLLKPNQILQSTKYFTARIAGPKGNDTSRHAQQLTEKRKRQTVYLDALSTRNNLTIFEGNYLAKKRKCRKCNAHWTIHEEKMTDVNIATELLVDAFQDKFDTALLISADSDLVSPVRSICELFPNKRVVVAFPPKRQSAQLKKVASSCFTIGRSKLVKSQLPQNITLSNGHILNRPTSWQ